MAVIYHDDLFEVRSTWFGRWRVLDKTSGVKILPDALLQDRLSKSWMLIQKKYKKMCPPDNWGERVLFQTFALAAVQPKGVAAGLFLMGSEDDLAIEMAREANIRYLMVEQLNGR